MWKGQPFYQKMGSMCEPLWEVPRCFLRKKGEGNIRAQYYTEIKKTFTRPSLANNLFTLYLTLWAIHMYTESICFILCVKVTYSDAIWRSRMVTQFDAKVVFICWLSSTLRVVFVWVCVPLYDWCILTNECIYWFKSVCMYNYRV